MSDSKVGKRFSAIRIREKWVGLGVDKWPSMRMVLTVSVVAPDAAGRVGGTLEFKGANYGSVRKDSQGGYRVCVMCMTFGLEEEECRPVFNSLIGDQR